VHYAHWEHFGFGRGALIALVVLSFWLWWPLGLGVLGWMAFARRNGWDPVPSRWYSGAQQGGDTRRGGPSGAPWGSQGGGFGPWGCGTRRNRAEPPSGNRAFDEYRAETLRRLEDEQREFVEYLERLRQARDKSEFDGFMNERRNRQAPTSPPPADTV
jgi:hypothetical protein